MKKLRVKLKENPYDICISENSEGLFSKILAPALKEKKVFLVSDSNVYEIYGKSFSEYLKSVSYFSGDYIFQAGETSKNFHTFECLVRSMVHAGLDRKSIVLALGGGVCGDIAGFAASTYMRGIDYIQLPTTLLSMVDSSVGGKTAIDIPEGKNLIGAFHQPKSVLIDVSKLNSLPEREFSAGMAEVIKYGMILDKDFFYFIKQNAGKIKDKSGKALTELISRSCFLKAAVVSEDEKEESLRAILNFGHTFGHSLEMVSSFNTFLHGEAVALGMLMACELGVNLELVKKDITIELENLLKEFHLPVRIGMNIDPENIYQAMFADKKTKSGKINFVVPERDIGKIRIISGIPKDAVIRAIEAYL
ncbi:MAG TPA: 3-dehydroquinate synthase [Lentisphaeria bacterium]|nr:MAG: 3-dehydroquinate synthase [Lentisphaerae bacterium GWF2_38_69]HBM15883.1 3-dehydroquinate synthase [Lentisphaeria bacterium]